MSQIVFNTIEPDSEISYNVTSNTAKSDGSTTISLSNNPILILNDRIRIFGDLITINRYYPFEYKSKKYLLYRPTKKVTEIYQIK